MFSARILGFTLLLAVATACSSSTNTPPANTAAASPPPSTFSQIPPAAPTTEASSAAGSGSSSASCADAVGDGGGNDITAVTLQIDGQTLHTTWTFARPPATGGTALWQVTAASLDGNQVVLFGVKFAGGQQTAHFVFTDTQLNLPDQAALSGKTLSADFPASYAEALGATWQWTAASTVDGQDVDACPEPGDDVLHPKQAMFPS
jgi:hypothetical protein